MKDAGGGTMGPDEWDSNRSMSLRSLLGEMARKYDQYDGYEQQDGEELLRHLLDSMEMEEKDVVKLVQGLPPPEPRRKRSRRAAELSPLSPLSPSDSRPASPNDSSTTSIRGLGTAEEASGAEPKPIPDDQRLMPFVDVLFGGSFVSVVVCETCHSVSILLAKIRVTESQVSHTYEGFLDVSLSLKADGPKPRKASFRLIRIDAELKSQRDRLRAMFKPKVSSKSQDHLFALSGPAAVSDTELSDTEPKEKDRRYSLDVDERPSEASLARAGSSKSFGIKSKAFSFRRRKPANSTSSLPAVDGEPERTPPGSPSLPASPIIPKEGTTISPSPAHAAYIQRILAMPGLDNTDPLARLKAANMGDHPASGSKPELGLIESLKAFTSVEVLEGENAFACRRCWKIKHGRFRGPKSHDAGAPPFGLRNLESPEPLSVQAPFIAPSISVIASDDSLPTTIESSQLDRTSSLSSRQSRSSLSLRTPSPLRMQATPSDPSTVSSDASTAMTSLDSYVPAVDNGISALATTGDTTDGLSDSDTTSEEELPLVLVEPTPDVDKKTKKSKDAVQPPREPHFIKRRAFKRYLVAKTPEILVIHFKRFKQAHKTSLLLTSFYDLKK